MIVITGATGKVGSKTVSELLARGRHVKAIARNAEILGTLKRQGAEIALGNMLDTAFLGKAFEGAEAVFLIIPPNMQAADVLIFQEKIGQAQMEAINHAGVKNIVYLSSLGTEGTENGSLVAGLGKMQKRLNFLPDDINVLTLRPTGFMENLLNQIDMIKYKNRIASPLKADLKTGFIATQDIAGVAANSLDKLDFIGKTSLDLLGNRDYTQREMAGIIGRAIGKPGLDYVEISFEDNKRALMQYGISESVADAMNVMWKNVNDGLYRVKRTPETITPTTLEYFAEHDFKMAMSRK
ncbi:NmrA family NAD(P)-binding protein [Flavitalea flava]